MSVGFWLVWTTWAGVHDDTGLFVIGSAMLAAGLAGGTAVAAAGGAAIRTAMEQARRRRGA